jgi:chlorite dismutase
MLGRTYASGFEPDLEDWLLARPRRTVLDPACPWGIWYPLRRSGAFARLSPQEQGAILKEHGTQGRAYGSGPGPRCAARLPRPRHSATTTS